MNKKSLEYCGIKHAGSAENSVCAPTKKYNHGSCYTNEELFAIAQAYNEEYRDNIIVLDKTKNLSEEESKKYLVKELTKRMNTCHDQRCWLRSRFIRRINKNLQHELHHNTFKPIGPQGRFKWLNTLDIENTMKQYEELYPDYKFLSAVPIDFDDLPSLGIANLNIEDLYKQGKTKIGIIYNLDEHYKRGSHWVAGYFDIKMGKIYFFDSYGSFPEKRIFALMKRFAKFYYNKEKKIPEIKYNEFRHQYKNSECGVYSLNFILRLLQGEKFEDVVSHPVNDDAINQCRRAYFDVSY